MLTPREQWKALYRAARSEQAAIDSSHVLFGPLIGSVRRPWSTGGLTRAAYDAVDWRRLYRLRDAYEWLCPGRELRFLAIKVADSWRSKDVTEGGRLPGKAHLRLVLAASDLGGQG